MIKKLPFSLRGIISALFILTLSVPAMASHIVGADLYYTWIAGNTYKITFIAYGDCGPSSSAAFSTLPTSSPNICIYDGASLVTNISLTINAPSAGVEITPVCPADSLNTQCHSAASTIPGIKKFVYTGNYTVPHPSANWRFIYNGYMGAGSAAGRAAALTNITTGSIMELIDTLNNSVHHNSSPILTTAPVPFFVQNNPDSYNSGAVDPDGDSLSFSLVAAMNGSGSATCSVGSPVTYVTTYPYSGSNPLHYWPGTFSFDSHTGQIFFNPDILQRSVVVYNIEEFRNDTLIGTSQREMSFKVIASSVPPPTGTFTGTSAGTVDDSTHFHICANNGPFSITLTPRETDTANHITVTSTGVPPGCTFGVTSNGTNHPIVHITWTSTGVAPGNYTIFITYQDDNCPLSNTQTMAYVVSILPIPTLGLTIISQPTCHDSGIIAITPGGQGNPWTVKGYDVPGDTTVSVPGVIGPFLVHLAPGTDTFVIFSVLSHYCNNFNVVSMATPTFVVPSGTYSDPTYCGNADGTIHLTGLHHTEIDTVRYLLNGVAQPPVIVLSSTTGEATLTGLCAGTYSDVTVTWGHCTSPPVGPFTLVNPPFTMSYLEFSSVSQCGGHDGWIKVHGLHPDQTDTLRYTLNGIAQPPYIAFVTADSTIYLNSMFAGTYSNFIANSTGTCPGAGCVSNTLGPILLTEPTLHPSFTETIKLGCKIDTVNFVNTSSPWGLGTRWYFGDGGTDTNANPSHIYHVAAGASYTVKLHVTNGVCNDSASTVINFTDNVVAAFTNTPDTMCQTLPVNFTNMSTGVGTNYVWDFGDGATSTLVNPVHTYPRTGIYPVTLITTDYIPCHDTAVRLVYVDSNAVTKLLATDTVFCVGGASTFDGIYTSIGLDSVIWSFGDGAGTMNVNPVQHAYLNTGSMTVTLNVFYRTCPDVTITKQLRVYPYPNIYLGEDTSICQGSGGITLYDQNNGSNNIASWLWNTGEYTPGINVTKPGKYHVTVSIHGCSSTDSININNDCYMDLPNVFTPNNDGVNDYFFPMQYLTKGVTTFSMKIYNRWGQEVFNTTSADGSGWDGKFNGSLQPQGVYVYIIDIHFKDGEKLHKQGNITLIK